MVNSPLISPYLLGGGGSFGGGTLGSHDIIDVVVCFTSLILRQLELTTSCTRILIGNKQIQ